MEGARLHDRALGRGRRRLLPGRGRIASERRRQGRAAGKTEGSDQERDEPDTLSPRDSLHRAPLRRSERLGRRSVAVTSGSTGGGITRTTFRPELVR